MWEIDRDYINGKGDDFVPSRVGTTGESVNIGVSPIAPDYIELPPGDVVRFRMKDDDGNVYYGGWLHNDPEGLNQQAALAYGMHDAGCTTIEVKDQGSRLWRQEIG